MGLEEFRQQLLALLGPCRLEINTFSLEEALKWSAPLSVTAKLLVEPGRHYPREEYPNNPPSLYGRGTTRTEALENLRTNLETRLPEWRQAITDDEDLATKVGSRVRVLKRDTYVNGTALKADFDNETKSSWAELCRRHTHVVEPGLEGVVLEHYPGRLKVGIAEHQFWVYRWKFYSGYYVGDSKELTPDAYYEFIQ